MKRLDLYLIWQFITILYISIIGFTCVFLVVDLIENLDRFIDNSVPWKIVFKYYLFYSLIFFVINSRLKDKDPMIFDFLIDFAISNELETRDQDNNLIYLRG